MNNALLVKNLCVNYGKYEVLNNVTFTVKKGDYVNIIGPNGAGKSTLIKAILNLIDKSGGEINVFNNLIGYLPQKTYSNELVFPATVSEIVATGMLANKKHPKLISKDERAKISEVLARLHIHDLKNRRIGSLSGGEQQRVLLARAIINNPTILILDEPTSALDPDFKKEFYEIIDKLNKEDKVTILLITHDISGIGNSKQKILLIDRKVEFFGDSKDYLKGRKE